MRMIKAVIGVRCVSCFVRPPATFLASPATLNLFDNPVCGSGSMDVESSYQLSNPILDEKIWMLNENDDDVFIRFFHLCYSTSY